MRSIRWRATAASALMVTFAWALAQAPAVAQIGRTSVVASVAGIQVHGHGEIQAKPDIARTTVSVVTDSRSQSRAIASNTSRATAVIAALKKAGVAAADIQTQAYEVSSQYNTNVSPAVKTGYQVTNSIRITIREISRSGAVVDAATTAGATDVSELEFDLADRHKAEGEALIAAVTDARAKADLMAGAAGVSLGPLISLSDGENAPVMLYRPMAAFSSPSSPALPPMPPITTGRLTITADVTATYGIGTAR